MNCSKAGYNNTVHYLINIWKIGGWCIAGNLCFIDILLLQQGGNVYTFVSYL